MSKILAFIKRDFCIDLSYRFNFIFQVSWVLLSTACYYFLSRFMEPHRGEGGLGAYGGSYFAFILIGVALNDYHTTSLSVFSRSIRESQLAGTLEALLTTQTSLTTVILSSAIYPFLWSSLRVVLYLVFGAWLFHLPLQAGNWPAAVLVLFLSIMVFSCFGVLSAAFIMLFKRTSPIPMVFEALAWLMGGILYPVTVLPDWLQRISSFLPVRYSIEGMRAALLGSSSWDRVWPSLAWLLLLATVTLPASLFVFSYATRRARIWGTLAQY